MVTPALAPRLHPTVVESSVPFFDCDPLGVVWHGNYLKYMDVARTAMLSPLGLDGEELVATGHRMYVTDVRCRHVAPLRFRDRVRTTAWLREWEQRLYIAYDVHNLTTARQAARAHTVLVVTDAAGKLLFDVPTIVRERLGVA
jgi:acyl-CoA thioester hydrolase